MDANKLVTEIYTIVNLLAEQKMDDLSGDTLSRLAVKLASYKASLGEYAALAKRDAALAETNYDDVRAQEYKRLRDEEGRGSTDANELKRLGVTVDAQRAWNEAKYNADRIVQLSMDCHDLIDGIKSRLINLQTERSEGRVS